VVLVQPMTTYIAETYNVVIVATMTMLCMTYMYVCLHNSVL